jgi:hypothetical protein
VRAVRFVIIVAYVGYLVNVGLLMLLLPWSAAWSTILTWIPYPLVTVLDLPALRGLISGFGLLHLLLLAAEMMPTRPAQHSP